MRAQSIDGLWSSPGGASSRYARAAAASGSDGTVQSLGGDLRKLVAPLERAEEIAVLDERERAAPEARPCPRAGTKIVDGLRAEILEQRRPVPDLVEALLPEIPRGDRMDDAREHVAVGRDHAGAPPRPAQLLALLGQAPHRLEELLRQHRIGEVGPEPVS